MSFISNKINIIINNIKSYNYTFINENLKNHIYQVIKNFFPKLNDNDLSNLTDFTTFLIEIISFKLNFSNESKYYEQWTQKQNRDIKSIMLLLLPYIDTNNEKLLNNLVDLRQILYYDYNNKYINKDIINYPKIDILEKYFKYSNFVIGLLDENKENLIELYSQHESLIYEIIFNNLITVLQTFTIMNGKFYTNWINFSPLNFNNYINSYIYINTYNKLDNFDKKYTDLNEHFIKMFNKELTDDLTNYKGLWLGDIYNILRNRFYDDIKSIRWLIFSYEYDDKKIYLIQHLNILLKLDSINEKNYLNSLIIFILDIKYKLENKLQNKTQNNNIDIDILTIKYLLSYYINSNEKHNNKLKKFIIDNIDNDNNDQDDYDKYNYKNITTNDLIYALENIDQDLILLHKYLINILNKFKKSPYGKYLMKDNKINMDYYYFTAMNQNIKLDNKTINLKNIYNIAKTLSHNDDWQIQSKNYLSLDFNNKYNFFYKIYKSNVTSWLNLRSNIKRQFINISVDYFNIILHIGQEFRKSLLTIIFEDLVYSGLLNEFNVNLDITNNKFSKDNFITYVNNNKYKWKDSYYHVTFDKYDNKTYFDTLCNSKWIYSYAMDWISQINFFHRYIYHRIIYITGATGIGKSTQVPKLLLYATLAFNFNTDGNIACSQPRQRPTTDIANRISNELQVPIMKNEIKTDNYYIQYQHHADKHIRENNRALTFLTDGILLNKLINNSLLFIELNNKYINKNVYDIIIIDEAHEHNTNMDVILTLMRQTCYYNNTIKLIITSATMNDDEPIYRRYFRSINDKLTYPIIYPYYCIFTYELLYIKSELLDRRYHISPPGETTGYPIEDKYTYIKSLDVTKFVTNIEIANIKRLNMNDILDKGCEIALEISSLPPKGHTLFFCSGESEIVYVVDKLNKTLPKNMIAIPYFRRLMEPYKKIVENIGSGYIKIPTPQNEIVNVWINAKKLDNSVITNYKYVIIVSTNIAEASLTIENLKYVIDNGFRIIVKYDYNTEISTAKTEPITESNRIQRRGRVGRIDSGIVYYLYQKDIKLKIPNYYDITITDFSELFFKLLYDPDDNEIFDIFDPNRLDTFYINDNIKDKSTYDPNSYLITTELYDILYNNYNFEIYTPDIIKKFYDIGEYSSHIYIRYKSGNTYENLIDNTGEFYIIHPFENNIQRNILYNILSYNNIKIVDKNKLNEICKYNNDLLLRKLINNNLLVKNNNIYIKSELGINVKKGENHFSSFDLRLNINNIITFFTAYALDCFDEVFFIYILLDILKNNERRFPYIFNNFQDYKTNYKYDSDLSVLYDIIKIIYHNFIKSKNNKITLQILEDKNKDIIFNYIKMKENDNIDEISNYIKIKIDDISNNVKNINYVILDIYLKIYQKTVTPTFIEKIYNSDIFTWIDKYKYNFKKCLSTDTIQEKITKAYFYGYASQYIFYDNNNKMYNSIYNKNIILSDTFIDHVKVSNNADRKLPQSLLLYINNFNQYNQLHCEIIIPIKFEWILEILINHYIFYLENPFVHNFKLQLKNKLKYNYVWNSIQDQKLYIHYHNILKKLKDI